MDSSDRDGAPVPAGDPGVPIGTKIGVVAGLAGALIALGAAIVTFAGASATGGPSEACTRAAACCRRMAGVSSAASTCDDYMKQSGPAAEQMCEETVKSYRHVGFCK